MRYRDSNAVFFLRADALWRVQISLPALNSAGSWTYCIRQCSPLQVTDELKRSVKGGLIRLIHLLKRPPRKQSQTHWHDILRMVKSRHMLLTSGCISDCISASCTALGTWNLSISSIIVVTRVFLPLLEKLRFPNVKKSSVFVRRFGTIFQFLQLWATSQQTVCRLWCEQLDDEDSTTHFRVGDPKTWCRGGGGGYFFYF